jgi:hypothetical protein
MRHNVPPRIHGCLYCGLDDGSGETLEKRGKEDKREGNSQAEQEATEEGTGKGRASEETRRGQEVREEDLVSFPSVQQTLSENVGMSECVGL